jgi:hypothetical protein
VQQQQQQHRGSAQHHEAQHHEAQPVQPHTAEGALSMWATAHLQLELQCYTAVASAACIPSVKERPWEFGHVPWALCTHDAVSTLMAQLRPYCSEVAPDTPPSRCSCHCRPVGCKPAPGRLAAVWSRTAGEPRRDPARLCCKCHPGSYEKVGKMERAAGSAVQA